ncbi:MAG TPA: GNAT family N-acetyltransferase [Acidothermaceae bacterium]
MDLAIEQVTTRSTADRWQRLSQICSDADYFELPTDPPQAVYEHIESARTDERYELWLGSVAGEPVVLGQLRLPLLDNVSNAIVEVATHPAFRRRGYATAMLERITERAQANDRSRLIGEICEPLLAVSTEIPGVAFATAAGAKPVTSEVRRVLRIAELDNDQLARLHDDAVAHSQGYSLVHWDGPAPAELVDDLAILHSRMSIDAPLEEMDWEPEQWSAERYRELEKRIVVSGQQRFSTAARHDASGQIVALTDIGVAHALPDSSYQWATIVLPEHRGHRLGMRVKLANLEFLRRSRPRVTIVNTWNAAINDHMVSINEAIGFRAVERWREWQLELPSQSPTFS